MNALSRANAFAPVVRAEVIFDSIPAGFTTFIVRNDDCLPRFQRGDVLIVDPSDNELIDGELYLRCYRNGRDKPSGPCEVVEANLRTTGFVGWWLALHNRPRSHAEMQADIAKGGVIVMSDGPYPDTDEGRAYIVEGLRGRVVGILSTLAPRPFDAEEWLAVYEKFIGPVALSTDNVMYFSEPVDMAAAPNISELHCALLAQSRTPNYDVLVKYIRAKRSDLHLRGYALMPDAWAKRVVQLGMRVMLNPQGKVEIGGDAAALLGDDAEEAWVLMNELDARDGWHRTIRLWLTDRFEPVNGWRVCDEGTFAATQPGPKFQIFAIDSPLAEQVPA